MAKKRGLGRGLDALLSGATIEQQMNTDLGPISNNDLKAVDGYQMLEVTKIQRGKYQPRRAHCEGVRARRQWACRGYLAGISAA